jgi:hypothetical protein
MFETCAQANAVTSPRLNHFYNDHDDVLMRTNIVQQKPRRPGFVVRPEHARQVPKYQKDQVDCRAVQSAKRK